MRNRFSLLLAAALVPLASVPAAAQVLTFAPELRGEVEDADRNSFVDALNAAVAANSQGATVLDVDATREALGDGADCTASECAAEAGALVAGSIGVYAWLNSEAEIFDFRVTVYRLSDGEILTEQPGECTFCPVDEAVESFRFTVQSAMNAFGEMPAPTAPVVAEPVVEPEPVAPADAYLVGEIPVSISAVPSTAVISVNGATVGTGRTELLLAPQTLTIEIVADGFDDYSEELTLRESMRGPIFMRASLAAQSGAVAETTVAEPCPVAEACPECETCEECPECPTLVCADGTAPVESSDRSAFNRRAVGGILAGTGAASLIGGIVLLAVDGDSTCSSGPLSACPEVFETTAGGAALVTLGSLALGTGVGLIIGDGGNNDRAAADARNARLEIAPRRGGAVFSFSGQF